MPVGLILWRLEFTVASHGVDFRNVNWSAWVCGACLYFYSYLLISGVVMCIAFDCLGLRRMGLARRVMAVAAFLVLSCGSVLAAESIKEGAVEDTSADPEAFSAWLLELRAEAIQKGIGEDTVDRVIKQIKHLPRVIAKDRTQAEFHETYEEYLAKRVSQWRIDKGRVLTGVIGAEVERVTSTYQVPARFVLAILGIETNYGTIGLSYSAFDVLATLSFDSRRGERFRSEIFASMQMLDKGLATDDQLKSSWAGALGQPQFMPTTYLQFAQDFNKDGRKDIWSQGDDLFASVANYLQHYGWQQNETWARKVILPVDKIKELEADKVNRVPLDKACVRYEKHLTGWKTLGQWNDLGVRRLNNTDLPKVNMAASLIVTDEAAGQGYLVYRNFCTLMRYNPSFKYALAVGALSDQIK